MNGDHMSASSFPPVIQSIFEEFIPICKQIAGDQRYAISVGGSLGKGTWDSRSDIDFRLFTDRELPRPKQRPELWSRLRRGHRALERTRHQHRWRLAAHRGRD